MKSPETTRSATARSPELHIAGIPAKTKKETPTNKLVYISKIHNPKVNRRGRERDSLAPSELPRIDPLPVRTPKLFIGGERRRVIGTHGTSRITTLVTSGINAYHFTKYLPLATSCPYLRERRRKEDARCKKAELDALNPESALNQTR